MKLVALVLVTACSLVFAKAHTKHTAKSTKSLAERLGGYTAISAVVDDFVGRVGANKEINGFFAKTDLNNLKKQLKDQICEAAGGFYDAKKTKPCVYTGKDMRTAHAGMGVQDNHFGALVKDLVASLDKFKVPAREKGELLAVLGPMKGAIVEPKATATTTEGTSAQ